MSKDEKQLLFYLKLKGEYEKGAKPYIYEFSFSEQPMHKKFRLILKKFIDVLKEGMKEEYRFEEGNEYSYWGELEKHFKDMDEMSFIVNNVYEVEEKKMRIFVALLLQTRRLFWVMEEVVHKLNYLYIDGKRKKQSFEKSLELVSFLKDGQLEVVSSYVQQFRQYVITKREAEFAVRREITQLLASMAQAAHDQIEREQKERLEREMKVKYEREQEEERKRQEIQEKKKKLIPIEKPKPAITLNQNINPKITPIDKTPFEPTPQEIRIKPKHLKNSQHLYNQKFKDEVEVFSYDPKPIAPGENKKECFQCKQPLGAGFFIFGSNINYCNYIGEWFCNDHTAEERVQIPYKAKEEFDLKGYSVSKSGYQRIKRYFQKPIIEIKYDDGVVKKNKRLYEFLILKRQIHLMYDSICNYELMDKMLKGRLNYCLRENLFSLKNLYDIYNGHETPHLEGEFSILSKHFYRCEVCQQRKGRLCAVCNHPPKIFAFELREAYSCERCQKISHRRCLMGSKCSCE